MEHISLVQLNKTIASVLSKHLEPSYWVVAEIAEMRVNQNGHCYLNLVEKAEGKILAKCSATIWSYTYRNLSVWFEKMTGQPIRSGLNILFNATVQFHEVYGFSLNIKDIDANYTIGERARKKAEIIQRLEDEGVLDMNRTLSLPSVAQRIAIISSETAAGYGDFMDQISKNEFGFQFHTNLYNSIMQGNDAPASIISSLLAINQTIDEYDMVVIIRGGGASTDLDCFDDYEVANHIAQFPIPVITGIGHERDETIADLVAHTKLKTPTAVSEFLISGLRAFEEKMIELFQLVVLYTERIINAESEKVSQFSSAFQLKSIQIVNSAQNELSQKATSIGFLANQKLNNQFSVIKDFVKSLNIQTHQLFKSEAERLKQIEKSIQWLDPNSILGKGYSITTFNGKPITSKNAPESNDEIETITQSMNIKSTVKEINKK